MKRVVVTGMGVVSPMGSGKEEFAKAMFEGRSGVSNIRGGFVDEKFPVPYAALIDRSKLAKPQNFSQEDYEQAPKSWLFSSLAAQEALEGLENSYNLDGIVYGTADGLSFDLVMESLRDFDPDNYDWKKVRSESPLLSINSLLQSQGRKVPQARQQISLNSACATGNQTLGVALEKIRSGQWERCLAGGVDARCEPSNLMNFFMLGALCSEEIEPAKASRPFAGDRSGFVRGEAAAALLLESEESAKARGAKILGYVSGYGFTSDAYRLTDGREDAMSVKEAMRQAIDTAGLSCEDIDYINAHGTSTPLNDRLESKAVKELFGEHAKKTPISSLKSQIGHSTIASSAVEAVASFLMLEKQMMAPTINYNVPDPDCDLDYVPNRSREARLRNILSNSFGFGGQNACLVMTHPEETA